VCPGALPSQPKYFLVTSPGYTATRWLARVLNSHPEIACNHSAGAEALERDYTLRELRELAEEKFGRRDDRSATQFLREFAERHPAARAVGNVHRYSLTALRRNAELWPGEVPRRVVNLIRHPVDWVASGAAQLGRMFCAVPVIRLRLRRQFWNRVALYRRLGVPLVLEPEELAFCYLCRRMEHLAQERRDFRALHLKMEQMIGDAEQFSAMFRRLTDLEPVGEYLQQVFSQGPLHQHNPKTHCTWQQQFEGWSLWKQRVFLHWFQHSGLQDVYADDYPELGELRIVQSGRGLPRSAPRNFIDGLLRIWSEITSRFRLPQADGVPTGHHSACRRRFVFICARQTAAEGTQTSGRLDTRNRKLIPDQILNCLPPMERERPLEQAVAGLPQLRAKTLPFFFLDPALALTHRKLRSELDTLGVIRQAFPTVLSPGLSGGAPALVEEEWWSTGGAAFVHPDRHDRSPAIILRHPGGGDVWYLNLKGAGIRRSDRSFVQRDGRYLAYQRTLQPNLTKPVDILVDRPGDEPLSHALIGGARLWAAIMEVRHALGWHRLLYKTDGRRADTCVPVRVTRYLELPSPDGRKVPTWDYFTNPRWMSGAQLEQLLSDTPGCGRAKRQFRRLLEENVAELERDRELRKTVGRAYLLRMQPVIYEHLSRGKLRVGHLWRLFNDDDQIRQTLAELKSDFEAPEVAALLRRFMIEVYTCNGYELTVPNILPHKLSETSGRFAFLKALYENNRVQADSMMRGVGGAAGRTLGALHGGGGHCWGWRVKQRDQTGKPLLDRTGLARRVGAPSGGATAPRNMTVCGEWLDLSHLYNPAADPVYRLFRLLSPVIKRWVPWICPRQVAVLQLCDLQLAELSVTQFAAIVQGNPDLIPLEQKEIRRLRLERRQIEVLLKTDRRNREQARLRDEMEVLAKRIHHLRLEQPPCGPNPALEAFQESYQAYSAS
jgi:hypothetical protein